MKVRVTWDEFQKAMRQTWSTNFDGAVPDIELEAEPVEQTKYPFEEKKPLTNFEKWIAVLSCSNLFYDTWDLCKWLDSKGVSADEAYRILIEEKK